LPTRNRRRAGSSACCRQPATDLENILGLPVGVVVSPSFEAPEPRRLVGHGMTDDVAPDARRHDLRHVPVLGHDEVRARARQLAEVRRVVCERVASRRRRIGLGEVQATRAGAMGAGRTADVVIAADGFGGATRVAVDDETLGVDDRAASALAEPLAPAQPATTMGKNRRARKGASGIPTGMSHNDTRLRMNHRREVDVRHDGMVTQARETTSATAARSRMTGKQRREQLLEVGRKLFADKGFEATTVEEIAAKAGVSKPVVYEHFGGKEGLYAVVVDREIRSLLDGMTGALSSDGHARVLLEQAALALLDYVETSTDGFRILVRDSPAGQSTGSFASLLSDVASQVEHILAAEFKHQKLDPKTAPIYAQMLVGMVALTGQWWMDSRKFKKEDVAAHLVNLAWNGLSGIKPKPTLRTVTKSPS